MESTVLRSSERSVLVASFMTIEMHDLRLGEQLSESAIYCWNLTGCGKMEPFPPQSTGGWTARNLSGQRCGSDPSFWGGAMVGLSVSTIGPTGLKLTSAAKCL